ncbi:MAG: protein kinase [Acidobacteria bacterium]|nr:protein kinase [Acidobacteriota bacterium]
MWDRIRDEFAKLVVLPPDERERELTLLPEEVRNEVESLLLAHQQTQGFLEWEDAKPGTAVGPYRIIEEIGRGGMGVVYRAERVDKEFRRTVALKVAGGRLFAPESARRFIRERQILARIEHPNIVRLLDGGMENGQRYFVMELIEGGPITQYCVDKALNLDERLQLFEDVCGALQYAHQHMILHRDLKASNIWVNREGVVKVLDFGIAQVLDDGDGGVSRTLTGLNPISMSAASPEQVRGTELTFASDVYALGLLLYEMLTGENPQQGEGLAMDTLMRRIFEEMPVAPSRKRSGLPRDLDAIVLKALEKDPERRYGSAGELAEDIRRLRGGHPVHAVPPSRWYRSQRFLARNRTVVGVSAVAAVIAVVAGASYVRQARVEERRFDDARRLIRKVIFDIQPGLQRFAGSTALRKTLITSTVEYLESVSRDAAGNPDLQRELARAYVEMGKVLGSPGWPNLGDAKTGKEYLRRAEKLIGEALEAAPSDANVLADATKVYTGLVYHGLPEVRYAQKAVELAQKRLAVRGDDAEALEDLGGAYFAEGQCLRIGFDPKAEDAYRRAGEVYRKLAEKKPGNRQLRRNVALTLRYRAQIALEEGRKEDLLRHAREASEISERILKEDPASQLAQTDAATDLGALAGALEVNGQELEGVTVRERSVRIKEAILRGDPGNGHAKLGLAIGDRDYCNMLIRSGDLARAEEHCRRSLRLLGELQREGKFLGLDKLNLAMTQALLGKALVRGKRLGEGCALVREALAGFEEQEKRTPGTAAVERQRKYALETHAACRAARAE